MGTTGVEVGPQGPTLTGTDEQALTQALRNLWPILSKAGRATALAAATTPTS